MIAHHRPLSAWVSSLVKLLLHSSFVQSSISPSRSGDAPRNRRLPYAVRIRNLRYSPCSRNTVIPSVTKGSIVTTGKIATDCQPARPNVADEDVSTLNADVIVVEELKIENWQLKNAKWIPLSKLNQMFQFSFYKLAFSMHLTLGRNMSWRVTPILPILQHFHQASPTP